MASFERNKAQVLHVVKLVKPLPLNPPSEAPEPVALVLLGPQQSLLPQRRPRQGRPYEHRLATGRFAPISRTHRQEDEEMEAEKDAAQSPDHAWRPEIEVGTDLEDDECNGKFM